MNLEGVGLGVWGVSQTGEGEEKYNRRLKNNKKDSGVGGVGGGGGKGWPSIAAGLTHCLEYQSVKCQRINQLFMRIHYMSGDGWQGWGAGGC